MLVLVKPVSAPHVKVELLPASASTHVKLEASTASASAEELIKDVVRIELRSTTLLLLLLNPLFASLIIDFSLFWV